MWSRIKKKLDGWKTIIWNGFIGVTPLILVSLDKLQALDLTPWMTPWVGIGVGFVISAVGVWLRYITTGPVGAKGSETPDPNVVKAGD